MIKFNKILKKTFALLITFTLVFGGYNVLAAFKDTALATTSPILELITYQTAQAGGAYTDAPKTIAHGQSVYFYLEIQNRNPASMAENTKVKVFLPDYLSNAVTTTATVSTTTPSAEPGGKISDAKAILTNLNASDLRLVYKTGSAKITGDLNNDGTKEFNNNALSDNIVLDGVNLGTLVGGANTLQISFEAVAAKVGVPNLTVAYTGMNVTKNTAWTDSTNADPGDTVKGYLEIHNTNVPSTATNLNVRIDLPQTGSGALTSRTFVKADNFAEISDPAVFNVSSGNLKLVSASAKITWDRDGDGVKEVNNQALPDTLFGSSGLVLGDLNGCNAYIIQMSFEAVVQPTGAAAPAPQVIIQQAPAPQVVEKRVVEVREIKELPKSGAEELGLVLSAGLVPLGFFLRRFRP